MVRLQLAQLLPLPVAVRMALPSWGFLAWRGLFVDPTPVAPIVVGVVVDLAWALAATTLAYLLFRRRDFTDLAYDGTGRRVAFGAVVPLVAVVAVTVGLLTVLVSYSSFKFPRLRPIIDGEPVIVVENGKPLDRNLARNRITREELAAAARAQGIDSFDKIRWAVLETSGNISFIQT